MASLEEGMNMTANMVPDTKELSLEEIEVELFIQGIYLKYGYDFRNYSKAHIKRRVRHRMAKENLRSISEMTERALHNSQWFYDILSDFSINVTEMYRDPEVFKMIREEVIPYLKSYPKLKIWHAGCSAGQEVYSMAIMLMEEGLYDRTTIYATDFNDNILRNAKEGIYPLDAVKEYTKNYITSGGVDDFSNYYTAKYDSVIMNQELKKNIVFANHNLVTDQDFASMQLIMCRNVLIYFDRELQNRVIRMMTDSLSNNGLLILGTKETIEYCDSKDNYLVLNKANRIYKKRSHNKLVK